MLNPSSKGVLYTFYLVPSASGVPFCKSAYSTSSSAGFKASSQVFCHSRREYPPCGSVDAMIIAFEVAYVVMREGKCVRAFKRMYAHTSSWIPAINE
eukprot:6635586-Pyramimonas_sp.AAC.2